MEIKTLEEIKSDLKGLFTTEDNFENEIIIAFGDYEVNGETEVMVENTNTETNIEGSGMCQVWCAYINEESSEAIKFAIKKSRNDIDDTYIEIVEVW